MITVSQLLERKGTDIWSVGPDDSVLDAIRMMADKGVGALLVLDKDELVGIVSERDYARKVILKGRSSKDTAVGAIMTEKVLYVTPERSLDEAMALMTEKRIRHLPVIDGERLIGVFSVGDVIKSIISEQEHIIDQLESYIKGR